MSTTCRAFGLVLTLTVIASCALITGTSDVKDRDLDRDGLLGPVRQVVTKSRVSTTVATYDRAGMLQHSVIRTPPAIEHPEAGEQLQKFIYVYGPDGRRLHEITEDGEGQQYISRLYAYDASGKKSAEAVYHMCGTFSALIMYSYDPDGLLREALTFHYRSILRQEFTYDQRRRLISCVAYKNGVLQSMTDYKYVDKGYPISEETTNVARPSLNEKSVSMYEYDAQGNWTKRTTRRLIMPIAEDGKPMFDPTELTERTIIYEKSR